MSDKKPQLDAGSADTPPEATTEHLRDASTELADANPQPMARVTGNASWLRERMAYPGWTIIAWLSATVVQVIAVGLVIAKSLFPPEST